MTWKQDSGMIMPYVHDGFLFIENQLCIPNVIQTTLIRHYVYGWKKKRVEKNEMKEKETRKWNLGFIVFPLKHIYPKLNEIIASFYSSKDVN